MTSPDPTTPTTPTTPAAPAADAAELRGQLVDTIAAQMELPPAVEMAMRTTPRHVFLPGVALADAYADEAVTIKDNPHGPLSLSCASVPSLVARMLVQLDVAPGDDVLEIGAGTGYNAALLSRLVGPRGSVTTIDIDSDVITHAQDALARLADHHGGADDDGAGRDGRGPITVLHRDGLLGAPEHAPFDRIIATVGMWDLPDPWWAQLADNRPATMVVPLRWRGLTRLVTLVRDGGTLVAEDLRLCGFVPVIGQDGERITSLLDDAVRLHHDRDQSIPAHQLRDVFDGHPVERWSKTTVVDNDGEDLSGIWLRATAETDQVCRIEVTEVALSLGVRRPAPVLVRSPVLVRDGSLAYTIALPEPQNGTKPRRSRLGALGYGPAGAAVAGSLLDIIDTWGADRHATPELRISPSLVDLDAPPGAHVIAKPDSRIVLSYPPRN